jgi:hypothetical protein
MKELFKSILCLVDLDELYIEALEFSRNLAQQNNAKTLRAQHRLRVWIGSWLGGG